MPKFPVWLRRIALYVFFCCLGAVVMYLVFEYRTVLRLQPEEWFGRVRAMLLTLAAVIGLPFLIWRTIIADKQNQINRESQHTELLTKAIELLGATRTGESRAPAPAIETRIGAIFALERLSKTSQTDYGSIIETLSAYVREQCEQPSEFHHQGDDPDEEGLPAQEKAIRLRKWCEALWKWTAEIKKHSIANREDVAAALLVLSRRKEDRQWQPSGEFKDVAPSLSEANLQGADLSTITVGLFPFDAGTSRTRVEGASLDGFKLSECSLIHPQIRHEITRSVAGPKALWGISAIGLTLKDADLLPEFYGAGLSFAHMDNAKCRNARFRGATLVSANFKCADLRGARFGSANASNACFDGANLGRAEYLGALLEGTQFVGAKLNDAQFQYAHLREVNLEGALLVRADFTGAHNINFEAIEKAFGTHDTILPDGIPLPSHWSDEASAIESWQAFRAANGICVSNQGR